MKAIYRRIEKFCKGTNERFNSELISSNEIDVRCGIRTILTITVEEYNRDCVIIKVDDVWCVGCVSKTRYAINDIDGIVLCVSNMLYFGDTADMRIHQVA